MIKTKPTGPIPPGYQTIEGELVIGGRKASALVSEHGSPLFVYSAGLLDTRMAQLRAAMPDALHLHYAMKANPFQPVLRHMVGLVDGIDIASGGELRMALAAEAAPEKIASVKGVSLKLAHQLKQHLRPDEQVAADEIPEGVAV